MPSRASCPASRQSSSSANCSSPSLTPVRSCGRLGVRCRQRHRHVQVGRAAGQRGAEQRHDEPRVGRVEQSGGAVGGQRVAGRRSRRSRRAARRPAAGRPAGRPRPSPGRGRSRPRPGIRRTSRRTAMAAAAPPTPPAPTRSMRTGHSGSRVRHTDYQNVTCGRLVGECPDWDKDPHDECRPPAARGTRRSRGGAQARRHLVPRRAGDRPGVHLARLLAGGHHRPGGRARRRLRARGAAGVVRADADDRLGLLLPQPGRPGLRHDVLLGHPRDGAVVGLDRRLGDRDDRRAGHRLARRHGRPVRPADVRARRRGGQQRRRDPAASWSSSWR